MGFGREEGSIGSDELIIFMGKGVKIKGDIRFEGSGRLDGQVEGKINVKGTLVLGEGAVVSSEIEGGNIIIGGQVNGKVIAHQKVQLLKTSVVNCDILTPSLIIEEGAKFNGSSKMGSTAENAPASIPIISGENKKKPMVQAVK